MYLSLLSNNLVELRMKESKSAATIRRRRPPPSPSPSPHSTSHARGVYLSGSKTNQYPDEDDTLEEDDVGGEMSVPGPKIWRVLMSSERALFISLLVFRALNALVIQTSYVPDEYWQSIEVAHNMAFG